MLWFEHEGQSNTKAVQFFFGPDGLRHSFSHTSSVLCPSTRLPCLSTPFQVGLWHTFIRTYPMNWSSVPNKPRVLDRAPRVETPLDYEGF